MEVVMVLPALDGRTRCRWAATDPVLADYHDNEWGVTPLDLAGWFERLTLEVFQAGLSWRTVLAKRPGFRTAFQDFEPKVVAAFGSKDVNRILRDPGIVRNRAKVLATINNARRCLDLVGEVGSLAAYAWVFEPDPRSRPQALDWDALVALGEAPEARAMSKDLRRRGWSFVGPTTVYSFMEAVGLVNDHVAACGVRDQAERERARFPRPTVA
jgi:DNA-3-methyladenine glycosylase I